MTPTQAETIVPSRRFLRDASPAFLWAACTLIIYGCVIAAILAPVSHQTSFRDPLTWLGSVALTNPGVVNAHANFMDADILLWGAEKFQAKQDPLDPQFLGESNIYYNYPSGWKFLAWLGLRRSDLMTFGLFLSLIYAAALWWVLPPVNGRNCLLHLLIIASPASINAMGEGNGELLVVALLAVSAKLAAKNNSFSLVISLAGLIGASLLKLYPAACFGVLFILVRKGKWIPGIAGLVVGGWFLWTFSEIQSIIDRTPRAILNGFGCEMIPVRAQMLLDASWLQADSRVTDFIKLFAKGEAVFRVAYFLVVGGFFWLGYHLLGKPRSRAENEETRALLLFGAVIFIGTFGIGSSWNHRLLASVPWLIAACRGQGRFVWALSLPGLLWLSTFHSGGWFLIEQTIFWSLLALCAIEVGRDVARYQGEDGAIRNDI